MDRKWLTDKIMAFTLRHALPEYISVNVSTPKDYELIVIYPVVLETFPKTCKPGDILKSHKGGKTREKSVPFS